MRVQHAGTHHGDNVEEHLREETAQEEGPLGDLRRPIRGVGVGDEEEPGERVGEDDPGQDDDGHGPEGKAEDGPGEAFGVLSTLFVEAGHQGGDEHRRQGARGDELEDEVRQRVGRLVGVAQERGAEDGRDDDDAYEAPEAAHERDCGHEGPRAPLRGCTVERGELRGIRSHAGARLTAGLPPVAAPPGLPPP